MWKCNIRKFQHVCSYPNVCKNRYWQCHFHWFNKCMKFNWNTLTRLQAVNRFYIYSLRMFHFFLVGFLVLISCLKTFWKTMLLYRHNIWIKLILRWHMLMLAGVCLRFFMFIGPSTFSSTSLLFPLFSLTYYFTSWRIFHSFLFFYFFFKANLENFNLK